MVRRWRRQTGEHQTKVQVWHCARRQEYGITGLSGRGFRGDRADGLLKHCNRGMHLTPDDPTPCGRRLRRPHPRGAIGQRSWVL